jgi:hypothetical protein
MPGGCESQAIALFPRTTTAYKEMTVRYLLPRAPLRRAFQTCDEVSRTFLDSSPSDAASGAQRKSITQTLREASLDSLAFFNQIISVFLILLCITREKISLLRSIELLAQRQRAFD